jgi:hypothetical protein
MVNWKQNKAKFVPVDEIDYKRKAVCQEASSLS